MEKDHDDDDVDVDVADDVADDVAARGGPAMTHIPTAVDEEHEEQRMRRDSDRRALLMDDDDLLDGEDEGDSKENAERRRMGHESGQKKAGRWAEPRVDQSASSRMKSSRGRGAGGGTPEVLTRKVKNRYSKEHFHPRLRGQKESLKNKGCADCGRTRKRCIESGK